MEIIGAASTVAGLLSLGITVSQSLLDYYQSWKDAEQNVAKTYVSIEELLKTLRLLNNIAVEYKELNSEVVDQIRDSIRSAEGSIHSLKTKLDKVRVVAIQDGWRDKAKAQFRRTLYPFKESTLAKLRELSSETRDNLNIALNILQIDASAASLSKLDSLGLQAANISANVDFLAQQSTSISNRELRTWLSGEIDASQKQHETWKERHPGTGRWFLDSPEFRKWLEQPVQLIPRVLNIIGKSGAGKTSLISSAIKAAQYEEKSDYHIAVAYFYCSFNDVASQDPDNMIGSFISQVSTVRPSILEGLEQGFSRKERPTLEDLEKRLAFQSARSSLKVLLFVDAVNECKKPDAMIECLLRLVESASDIRVLFTSTEEDTVITDLSDLKVPKATVFRMPAQGGDIDLFIEAKMKEKRNLQRLSPEMREEIKTVLSRKADGMFRWVQCQIEHLGNQSTGKKVQKALRELPHDLNSTYANIMARIPEDNQEFARETLLWLSFAFRPLKLSELCETLAFDESDTTVDESDRLLDSHDLLRWCQGLITYHPKTSNVTISHASVYTYLLSDQIKTGPSSFFSIDETMAERLLFRKCLTYVMFTDFAKGYCISYPKWKLLSHQWPLLSYASSHWAAHAYALDTALEPSDQTLISRLYDTSKSERGGNFGFWVQCLYPKASVQVARDTQPLYYAASFGLRAVVRSLITTNKDINLDALGGRNASTAVQVACFRGYYGVAKDLLEAGANPYHRDRFGHSSLLCALRYGYEDIAELLRLFLHSRTDPNGDSPSEHIKEAVDSARRLLAPRKAVKEESS